MIQDAVPVPTELLVFVLGIVAAACMAWLRKWLEGLKAQTDRHDERINEADEAGHEQTVKLTEVIATILTEMQEHRRRIDRIETNAADAAESATETARAVTIHGEQARVAITDVAALKTEVRMLSDAFIHFRFVIEAHDKRTSENTAKLDRLFDLFTRGLERVAPAR